jgi:hypothetical protein
MSAMKQHDDDDPTTVMFNQAARFYQVYEDQREFPRVDLQRPGVVLFEGDNLTVKVHNVSPDGVQIRCAKPIAARLNPSGRAIPENGGPNVKLAFAVPDAGGKLCTMTTPCRIWYFAVHPKGDIVFGLRFEDPRADGLKPVRDFLAAAMAPGE